MSSLSTQNPGDLILADHHNQIYNLLKGVAGNGEAITLVHNGAGVITFTPSSDPAASTELFIINNNAGTRQFAITAGGDLVGTGGILTLPAGADTLVGRATTDTLTNKTLTAPVIATVVNSGTLTLPSSTDTLVGRDTTDTLTNKTLTAPTIADFTNAQHDHGDADDGGAIATTERLSFALHLGGSSDQVGSSATSWLPIASQPAVGFFSTEAEVQLPVARAGTLTGISVRTRSAQDGGGSLVATLRVNGADTALVATVTAGGAAGTYADTGEAVAVALGDLLAIRLVNNSSFNAAGITGIVIG